MKRSDLINNEGTINIDTAIQLPFSITFSCKSEWATVQLVNESDVLKLADIFAKMLKKNSIDYTIIKSNNTK